MLGQLIDQHIRDALYGFRRILIHKLHLMGIQRWIISILFSVDCATLSEPDISFIHANAGIAATLCPDSTLTNKLAWSHISPHHSLGFQFHVPGALEHNLTTHHFPPLSCRTPTLTQSGKFCRYFGHCAAKECFLCFVFEVVTKLISATLVWVREGLLSQDDVRRLPTGSRIEPRSTYTAISLVTVANVVESAAGN